MKNYKRKRNLRRLLAFQEKKKLESELTPSAGKMTSNKSDIKTISFVTSKMTPYLKSENPLLGSNHIYIHSDSEEDYTISTLMRMYQPSKSNTCSNTKYKPY